MSGHGRWRRVDGVLLLDKPPGMTSNAALQAARRLFAAEKAGHTGTLDPLATGLLPVLFGEATKFGTGLLDADKGYAAAVRLGARTTTGDAEGDVVERSEVRVSVEAIEAAAARFRGAIDQLPPMHSALKHKGRPLYAYARAGEEVERAARRIHVHELVVERFEADSVHLRVRCSKGTYVRVLAEDLGKALGCGAHLQALRRTHAGPFGVDSAVTLPELEALGDAARMGLLRPVDALVAHLPQATLGPDEAGRFVQGRAVTAPGPDGPGARRVYAAEGGFLGLGQLDDAGLLHPRRLMAHHATASAAVTESCESP